MYWWWWWSSSHSPFFCHDNDVCICDLLIMNMLTMSLMYWSCRSSLYLWFLALFQNKNIDITKLFWNRSGYCWELVVLLSVVQQVIFCMSNRSVSLWKIIGKIILCNTFQISLNVAVLLVTWWQMLTVEYYTKHSWIDLTSLRVLPLVPCEGLLQYICIYIVVVSVLC